MRTIQIHKDLPGVFNKVWLPSDGNENQLFHPKKIVSMCSCIGQWFSTESDNRQRGLEKMYASLPIDW